jgi:DUF3102 family protein
MRGSNVQTIRPATQGPAQDRRRSPRDPRDPRGQAGTHRLARARTAGAVPQRDLAPSSEPVRGDEEIAREINTEHRRVETHKRNTIQHAIRCGELLLEVKRRVGHGNWLAWVAEHFEASERTARNYMEIAKSAAVADLSDDATMRSALRTLASRSQSDEETKREQAATMPANGRLPLEDDERHIADAEAIETPRASLGEADQSTWASVPSRLTTIRRVFGEAASGELDDQSASKVLYEAAREARQTAMDLELLAAALEKRGG